MLMMQRVFTSFVNSYYSDPNTVYIALTARDLLRLRDWSGSGRSSGTYGGHYVTSRWHGTAGASGMRYGWGTTVTELTSKLYSHLPAYWWKGEKKKGNWSQTVTQEESHLSVKANPTASHRRCVWWQITAITQDQILTSLFTHDEMKLFSITCDVFTALLFTWDHPRVTGQHNFMALEGQKRAGMSQPGHAHHQPNGAAGQPNTGSKHPQKYLPQAQSPNTGGKHTHKSHQ